MVMNTQDLNKAVAESLGYPVYKTVTGALRVNIPDGHQSFSTPLPRFTTSHDAILPHIRSLSTEERRVFQSCLQDVMSEGLGVQIGKDKGLFATAEQLARAWVAMKEIDRERGAIK